MSAVAVLDSTNHGYAVPAPAAPRRRSQPRLVLVPTGDAVVAEATPKLRLTRAGRLVLTGTVVAALALVAFLTFTGGAAASGQLPTVTVESGQTLSQIAAEHMSGSSVATAVAELQLANGLSSAQVHAGQTLVIPQR